jgi:hypothetical protein
VERNRGFLVNAVLAVGAAVVLTGASAVLPAADAGSLSPLELAIPGALFQLCIAAAALVIVVVNARVLGNSPALLWRASPRARTKWFRVVTAGFGLLSLVIWRCTWTGPLRRG